MPDELSQGGDQKVYALFSTFELTADTEHVYRNAKPNERRLLNQAFFEAIEVAVDEIANHTLQPPFRQIKAAAGLQTAPPGTAPQRGPEGGNSARSPNGRGSYEKQLMEAVGIEPTSAESDEGSRPAETRRALRSRD